MGNLKELFPGNWHFNVMFALLLLATATLPLTNYLMLPIAFLLLLNWIGEWNWREKIQNLRAWKATPLLICSTLIFLMLIPGILISCNKSEATSAFECSLWIAVAPLILLTTNPSKLTRKHIQIALGVFVSGTIVHVLTILSVAIYKFIITGKTLYFYYSPLSILKHPSYVSMYCTFSFFVLLNFLSTYKSKFSFNKRIILIAAMALLFTAVILLQSKAGLLAMFLLIFCWIFYQYCIVRKKILTGIIITATIVTAVIVVFQSGWIRKNRVLESIEQVQKHKSNPYGTDSSEMRLTLWKCAWEVSVENLPWGVGTGDGTEELNLHALKKNYTNLIGRHYNAHCQYLQTLMETGIPGLLCLLIFCFYPLIFSIKRRNFLYFSFSVLLIINIAVECMFQVRAGTNFFPLANMLLFLNYQSNEKERNICVNS